MAFRNVVFTPQNNLRTFPGECIFTLDLTSAMTFDANCLPMKAYPSVAALLIGDFRNKSDEILLQDLVSQENHSTLRQHKCRRRLRDIAGFCGRAYKHTLSEIFTAESSHETLP